jgi:hypothetical protein
MRRGVRLREIGAHESRVLPKSVELALRAARGRGFRCIRDLRGARDVAHTMVRFIQDAAWFTDRFQKASQKFAEDPQFQVSQPRSCCQELEQETPGVTAASRCELIVLSALISSWSTAWRAWLSSCPQPGDQYTLLKGLR